MKKEFVIYEGRAFTLEWYYDLRSRSNGLEYFESLTTDRKKKAFSLFQLMGDAGRINNVEKFRYEGDQIYAFKPSPDRFLCFFNKDAKVIITNAFEKKSQKFPETEKERAMRNRDDYIDRIEKGLYYD